VPAEVFAACNWTAGTGAAGRGARGQRRLHVEVRVSLPRANLSGLEAARRQYAAALAAAEDMAAKRLTVDTGTVEHWAVLPLRDLGDGGFAQYEQTQGDTARAGLGRVVARLRNAVVTVEYSGANYPVGQNGFPDRSRASPLDGSTAQQGAAGVAIQLTKALAACVVCMD
jgi:hypothetical protein